jgi:hypothetical protein
MIFHGEKCPSNNRRCYKKYNIPVVYNFPADTSATTELVMGSIVHLDVSAEKVF